MLRATRNTRAGTCTPDYGLHCSRYMRKIRFCLQVGHIFSQLQAWCKKLLHKFSGVAHKTRSARTLNADKAAALTTPVYTLPFRELLF